MPKTIGDMLSAAVELHSSGRVSEAEQIFQAIHAQVPTHPDVNHNLGVIAFSRASYLKSAAFIRKAIAISPNIGQFYETLLATLKKSCEFDSASKLIGFSRIIVPRHCNNWRETKAELKKKAQSQIRERSIFLGVYGRSDFKRVIGLFDTLSYKNSRDPKILFCLGSSYMHLGEFETALSILQRLSDRGGASDVVYRDVGKLQYELSDYDGAEINLKKA